jgi:tetratricopeptide (TPR) repeat protein
MNAYFFKISEALEQRKFKQALELLAYLSADFPRNQLEMLLNLENTYKIMLSYVAKGVKDPQQEKIYNDLFITAYLLADQTMLTTKTIHSWSHIYEMRKASLYTQNEDSGHLVASINKLMSKIATTDLSNVGEETTQRLQVIEKEREEIEGKVFRCILTSNTLTAEEERHWWEALHNESNPNTLRCLIVAALILNLEELFDVRKINLLLSVCEDRDEEIRQRALTGVLLFLRRYDKRLYLYPNINHRLQHLSEDKRFIRDIRHIMLQFILSRETERITRIMREEIIPCMMKIKPLLNDKLQMEDILSETGFEEKNPEWLELIEESGLGKRLQEFTELHMEGADILHSSFLHLKHFPFFDEIHHWFAPFVPPLNPQDKKWAKMGKLLLESPFLCNSDKYSFYYCVIRMPQTYGKILTKQFSVENTDFQKLLEEELPGSEAAKIHPAARRFIQDLYRFYKLFPRRRNIEDIFEMKPEFYQTPSIAGFISDSESLTVIGEYYFQRNYFEEAADVFNILLQKDVNNETLLQKRGYCLQMMGKWEEALDSYLKAELLNSNNSWTIKKLAHCYRALKQFQEALSYYRKAERLHPDNLSIQLSIGHCYLELKNYSEALKYYFKVEYLADNKEKAWRPIAWCSFLTGKYEQALDYFKKIIDSNPNDTDYLNAGHTCLAMGDNREALKLYKSSLAVDGNSFEKFAKTFTADVPDLLNAGVKPDDIPVILDCLVYEI